MIDRLLQDLRYALRSLAKSPAFTAAAILTLALGIGANSAIFTIAERVLLRPLPYYDSAKLVQIWNSYLPGFPQVEMSPGDFQDFKQQSRSFSQMAAYVSLPQGFNLTGDGEAQRLEARYATSGFLPLLGIRPVAGRNFVPEEDQPGAALTVIISHRLWQDRFGSDSQAIGRMLQLDGKSYQLIGVLPQDFQISPNADIWLPIGEFGDDLTSHIHHEFDIVARLKPNVSLPQARAEVESLNRSEEAAFPDTHKNWGVVVKPLQDLSAAKMRTALLLLFAAVGLVLLIACANIVNLLLARNAVRQKEIALRVALGASRARLLAQLLTESTLLSLIGGALGIGVAVAALHILKLFLPPDLPSLQDATLNGWVLGFTLGVSLLTGIVCGLIPAAVGLKSNLIGVLKEGTRAPGLGAGQKIRSLLVISEIALALVPLMGAGLLIRSLMHLVEVDPGFQSQHILAMEVEQPQLTFEEFNKLSSRQQIELSRKQSVQFDELARRILELPAVSAVGGVNVLPVGDVLRSASRFVLEGQPLPANGARPIAETRTASIGYFSTLGIPLKAGRSLDQHDYGTQNILVNEELARRYWPHGDALNKRINLCSLDPTPCWSPIVGIVGDVHQYGLDAKPTLDVYFTGGWTRDLVIRTSSDPAALARAVKETIHAFDPTLPIAHVVTLDQVLSESMSPRRFASFILGVFAVLALALASIGVYGVMSYIVNLRTSEIGIRMALGAQASDIQKLILVRGARLALLGIIFGVAGSVALAKSASSLLYGVTPADPSSLIGASLLLVVVALFACYVPARRAIRVDPLAALRHQ